MKYKEVLIYEQEDGFFEIPDDALIGQYGSEEGIKKIRKWIRVFAPVDEELKK